MLECLAPLRHELALNSRVVISDHSCRGYVDPLGTQAGLSFVKLVSNFLGCIPPNNLLNFDLVDFALHQV